MPRASNFHSKFPIAILQAVFITLACYMPNPSLYDVNILIFQDFFLLGCNSM
jgi:hypothetical protein